MELEISKVTLLKTKQGHGLKIIGKRKVNNDESDFDEKHKALIHRDLFSAIQALAPHYAVLSDYIKPIGFDRIQPEHLEKYHVNGFSIGGPEESRGVIISGHKIAFNGLAVIVNTPFIRFEQGQESRYQHADDLISKLDKVNSEVLLYLDGSKRGEPQQPEIEFPGDKASPEAQFASEADQFKYAGTEQMAAVAGLENGAAANGKAKRKVKQTPEHPSGEA